jgi:hypothetical protein
MQTQIYINYLLLTGLCFLMVTLLDFIYRKTFKRVLRNLFFSLLWSFGWVILDKSVSWGVAILILALFGGDWFYNRFLSFHKPIPSKKENPDGTVL